MNPSTWTPLLKNRRIDVIAFGKFINELRRLGKENPDKISVADYFGREDRSVPVCIVGHAFVNLNLGISGGPSALLRDDGIVVGDRSDTIRELQWDLLGIRKPTGRQLKWAAKVQEVQDENLTWGEAVACADRTVELAVA